MGIDYAIESTINKQKYENTPERFLKYALRDINYVEIFNILDIRLYILYDHAIRFWSCDQVKMMYQLIKDLYESPTKIIYDDDPEEVNKLLLQVAGMRQDIYELMKKFEEYVDDKCEIHVF